MSLSGAHTHAALGASGCRMPFVDVTNTDADAGGDKSAMRLSFPFNSSARTCPSATRCQMTLSTGNDVDCSDVALPLQDRTPRSTENSAADVSHTPVRNAEARGNRLAGTSSVPIDAIDRAHCPRKFLQNYFFLKALNALPSTPESRKKETSSPFIRSTFCKPASPNISLPIPPPPPSSNSINTKSSSAELPRQHHTEQRFVRQCVYSASTKHAFSSMDILPSKAQDCSVTVGLCGSGGGAGNSDNSSVNPMLLPVPVEFLEHLPAPVETMPRHNVVPCSSIKSDAVRTVVKVSNNGGGRHSCEASSRSLTPQGQSGDMATESHIPHSMMEPSQCAGDIVVDGTCLVSAEEVLVQVEKFTMPPFLASPLPTADGLQEKKRLPSPLNNHGSAFSENSMQLHTGTMEHMATFGKEGFSCIGFLGAGAVCSDADDLCCLLEEFFLKYCKEQFKLYQEQILDVAFTSMYTQMVAIPAVKMLEYHGRRLICCLRDLGIRSMIELFLIIAEWICKYRRCSSSVNSTSMQSVRRFVTSLQGRLMPSLPKKSDRCTSHRAKVGETTHESRNGEVWMQHRAKRQGHEMVVTPRSLVSNLLKPQRGILYQVDHHILRAHAPKKSTRGEDLDDMASLLPRV